MARVVRRCLPMAEALPSRRPVIAGFALLWIAMVAVLALGAVNAVFGVGGHGMLAFVRNWLSPALYLIAALIVSLRAATTPGRSLPFVVIAVGFSLYSIGNIVWVAVYAGWANPPIPSICDGMWLALYPLSYLGIIGLARGRDGTRLPAWAWLDGIIAGAGIAAVGSALVLPKVLGVGHETTVARVVEAAYPVGDLLLAAFVVGVLSLRSWRLDRLWALLVAGFISLTVADCMYAIQITAGSANPSGPTNLVYLIGVVLIAAAVWQRHEEPAELQLGGWSALLVPGLALATVLGLLVYGAGPARLDSVTLGLCVLALVATAPRIGLMFRDLKTLGEARTEATTDELTGLPNRRAFMRRLTAAIASARTAGGGLVLMIIDLDNFKQLNDTLGHFAGDSLLAQVGPRLAATLRDTDMIARLGGDEFAVLVDPAPSRAGLTFVCTKLLAALRDPFELSGLTLRITASLGVAQYPCAGQDGGELLQHADVAMYQAKAQRSGYTIYAADSDHHTKARLSLTAELATAIDGGELEVHFQPQVVAGTRRIVAAEALVRWRTTDGRLIPPSEFLPAAEQAGLARALTNRVVAVSLDTLARWRAQGHELAMSVNTTVADLLDPTFPDEIAQALAARDLPPHLLTLELTETSMMVDPERIGVTLRELRDRGVQLSLDDFGTGYSSLAHLRELPVHEMKIDRSFVRQMRSDPVDAAIVDATASLARRLGLRVVAEGVEDDATWDAVTAAGCDLVQGYGFSRPVPAPEFEAKLETQVRV